MGDWQPRTNLTDESANQRGEKSLSKFLTTGLYNGASAGCVSAASFILLILIIFASSIGGFDGGIFLVGLVAFIYGYVPAMIIACLFGLLSGFVYFLIKSQITDGKWSIIVSLVLSLSIAFPAITFWWVFFLSGFQIEQVRFEGFPYAYWIFMPFCIAAGLYIGKKLHNIITNDGDDVYE